MTDRPLHEFLEVLAREIRKPLEPARTAAEDIRMTSEDPNAQRLGEIVNRQVALVYQTLDALQDLALLQQGALSRADDVVDLLRILELAVEECRPALEAKSQRLVVDIPDSNPQVIGAEFRLVQIFRALVDNAVKFTPEAGSVQLSIVTEEPYVRVIVRDTGCGMDAALLTQIFDPLALATPVEREGGGVGLGLTVTKLLIDLHGGELSAYSDGPGAGSQFVVTLPLAT